LQRTTMTVPAVAARIGVPRGAPRSTPSWVGRSGVRDSETIAARTGSVHDCGAGGAGRPKPPAVGVSARPSHAAGADGRAWAAGRGVGDVVGCLCPPERGAAPHTGGQRHQTPGRGQGYRHDNKVRRARRGVAWTLM